MIDKNTINLMPYQWVPFNGDNYIEQEFINLRDKFGIETVVELGTCLGSSTIFLAKNFESVITIEINKGYADIAQERFLDRVGFKNKIELLVGDTVNVLPNIINAIDDNSIFWIDSHWGANCPLEKELGIIAEAGIKPVIVIHDFQVPDKPEFGFDEYNGQPFTFAWLKPLFDKIYGEEGYDYYYNTGILENSAKRGIIYLIPKEK